jgi:hypothetical protein
VRARHGSGSEERTGHQRGEPLHKFQRRHDNRGAAVFVGTLQLRHDLAGAVTLEPLIGDRRVGDIAAQVLKLLALIDPQRTAPFGLKPWSLAHRPGVDGCVWARHTLQVQHLLPGSWPERDAVDARVACGGESAKSITSSYLTSIMRYFGKFGDLLLGNLQGSTYKIANVGSLNLSTLAKACSNVGWK